jgi:NitT/TauT family transport system substrate-binding protein
MHYGVFRTAIPALAIALLAAGCAAARASGLPPKVEKPDLTVAAVPALDSAPLYIAQERHLFADQGLHVKIVPAVSGATTISGLEKGTYDVGVGSYVSFILVDAVDHVKMHILAAGSVMAPHAQDLMVLHGSPIHSIQQLKGQRIGVNVLNNIGTLLISSLLADNLMSPSQVHFVPIPFPNMITALKEHKIAAAFLPEPFATTGEEAIGAQPLADLDTGAVSGLPISGYVVTQSWMQKYPKTAAAFRRAILKAQAIGDTDPAAVHQAMVAFTGTPRIVAAMMPNLTYPVDTDPVPIQRIADLMLRFGTLSHRFNVMPMIRGLFGCEACRAARTAGEG